MKVVINNCYGGFGLSKEAYEWLKISCSELYGTYHCADDLNMDSKEFRSDDALVNCVEALGSKANGSFANLKIVEIPEDCEDWYIDEYDGLECIREGRVWG